MKKKILLIPLIILSFILGRISVPEDDPTLIDVIEQKETDVIEDQFPELSFDISYFNNSDVRSGSAEHYKEYEQGDIRRHSRAYLENKAVYQSYPTKEIILTEYDSSKRKLEIKPFNEALDELKNNCGDLTSKVSLAEENYRQYGIWTTHYLPAWQIYKVESFDVDGDDVEEMIIHKNINCRATGGSFDADIIKNGEIVFSTTGHNSAIIPADTNNGFYVEQSDTVGCCATGFLRTRFVFENDEFVPIYGQEVKYLKVKESSENIAVAIVRELSEVKEWLDLFPNNKSALGGAPIIEVDHMNESLYVVHVYELLPSHTATMNWYHVNVETREAEPQF
jgi:hypothetical protein